MSSTGLLEGQSVTCLARPSFLTQKLDSKRAEVYSGRQGQAQATQVPGSRDGLPLDGECVAVTLKGMKGSGRVVCCLLL